MSAMPPPPPPYEPPVPGYQTPPPAPYNGDIPTHLAWTIIATVVSACLCCGLGLIGIVGIVYATQVNAKLNQGDIEGARRASNNAKIWAWVATGLAILGLLINIWSFATGGAASYMETMQQLRQSR